MKTKEEIFGPADNAEDYVDHVKVYPQQIVFKKADEYAEEYAKAFFVFCRKKVGEPELAEYLSNSYMQDFKESLKK